MSLEAALYGYRPASMKVIPTSTPLDKKGHHEI